MSKRRKQPKPKQQKPAPLVAGELMRQDFNGKLPKDPEELARLWHQLSGEHFESFKAIRELCLEVVGLAKEQFESQRENLLKDQIGGGEIIRDEAGISYSLPEMPIQLYEPKQLRAIASTMKLAVEGERQAVKMQFDDRTVAVQVVEQLGFILQKPDGTIDIDASVVEMAPTDPDSTFVD